MCVFWSYTAFHIPELFPYRYIWRLDTDSAFDNPVTNDLIGEVHKARAVFITYQFVADHPPCYEGLAEETERWYRSQPAGAAAATLQLPGGPGDRKVFANESIASFTGQIWYNNIAVYDALYFRRDRAFASYFEAMYASGGFLRSRSAQL